MLLALAFVLSAAAAKEQWLYAKSDHFEMYSSASEKQSRQMLVKLEQFRAFFLASFPLRRAREPRAIVVLFGSDRGFRPYKPLYKGEAKDVGGVFIGNDDEAMMALTSDIDPDAYEDPSEIILHEYVHQILHTRGMHPPLWLNEGLAEVYSSFDIDGNQVELGKPKRDYVEFLQESRLTPLKEVFAVTEDSKDYNEEDRAGAFYAESWALTHFLLCGEDRTNAAKLSRFLELMEISPDKMEANFKTAFGMGYRGMENALRDYLSGGRYYKRTAKLPISDLAARLKFRPATDFERDMVLLDLQWRVRQGAGTAAAAIALAERNPTSPRPHELLATVYANDDKTEEAISHLERAAALNSDNPWVYVQLAREAILHTDQTMQFGAFLPEPLVAQLRGWIDHALAISPDSADALEMLAITEAHAAHMRNAAINRVQAAVPNIRDPLPTLFALAIVRSRVGDVKTCQEILSTILAAREAPPGLLAAVEAMRAAVSRPKTPALSGVARTEPPATDALPNVGGSLLDTAASGSNRTADTLGAADQSIRGAADGMVLANFQPALSLPRDEWERFEQAHQRAAGGDVGAMFDVALAHATGNGAEFDPAEAFAWLQKAADAGHDAARAILKSARKDPEKTARLLRERDPDASAMLPPFESDLQAKIAAAAAKGKDAPLQVVYQSMPRYPVSLRQSGGKGRVTIAFVVDASGHPQDVKASEGTNPELVELAEACVKRWRFIPAIKQGKPVLSRVQVPVQFGSD